MSAFNTATLRAEVHCPSIRMLHALRALNPPVGVYFEDSGLCTSSMASSDLPLCLLMYLAEKESKNKKQNTFHKGCRFDFTGDRSERDSPVCYLCHGIMK